LQAFEKNPTILQCIPTDHIDKSMCLKAIQFDPYNIVHTPKHILDEQMCIASITANPNMYDKVPEEMRTVAVKWEYYKKKCFG